MSEPTRHEPPHQDMNPYKTHAASTRALWCVLAPATMIAAPLNTFVRLTSQPWFIILMLGAALLLAGLMHSARRIWTRALATLSIMIWTVCTLLERNTNPLRGLVILLGVIVVISFIWPSTRLQRGVLQEDLSPRTSDYNLRLISAVALFFGFDAWHLGTSSEHIEPLALSAMYMVLILYAFSQDIFTRARTRLLGVAMCGVGLLPLMTVAAHVMGHDLALTHVGLWTPLMMLALLAHRAMLSWLRPVTQIEEPGLLTAVLVHPSRVLVISFMMMCVAGTLLLGLPIASSSGHAISWIDAAFTAVSATCVTGLGVVDTSQAFGAFGKVVVLILIQLGGLGIMVFSAAAIVLFGKRLSLSHERAAVDLVGASGLAGLSRAIRAVLVVTFATEGVSALLLFFGFIARGDDVGMAAWRALFTSISAFCNAGFSLQSDSLMPYADSPYILAVISLTIIIAGLGPLVIVAMLGWRDQIRRSLHARIVIWSSALLILIPALLITAFEWNGTLLDMSIMDKLSNGLFQSITLRTAGFNSIDLSQIHPATWTIMLLVMYVGGSPGSTAGGIKTTTFAVLLLALLAVIRGKDRVEVFGRTLPHTTVLRAFAVATLGAAMGFIAITTLLITQTIPLESVLFEVVSALATVGLSIGATAELDTVGKAIIIACMFAGRVGPITLFVFMTANSSAHLSRHYPKETVPIG